MINFISMSPVLEPLAKHHDIYFAAVRLFILTTNCLSGPIVPDKSKFGCGIPFDARASLSTSMSNADNMTTTATTISYIATFLPGQKEVPPPNGRIEYIRSLNDFDLVLPGIVIASADSVCPSLMATCCSPSASNLIHPLISFPILPLSSCSSSINLSAQNSEASGNEPFGDQTFGSFCISLPGINIVPPL
ncbi:hypothetical protein I7I48_08783 [Histoplasma ohiense]|nr:hypothetical protein I7I48_08783 [Histoplasma ohiense (nom. inval.)]